MLLKSVTTGKCANQLTRKLVIFLSQLQITELCSNMVDISDREENYSNITNGCATSRACHSVFKKH